MPVHADSTKHDPEELAPTGGAGSLDIYTPSAAKPWNARRVAHVYRRLGFGATLEQIQAGLLLAPDVLIDQLLDTAANAGTPLPPYWAAYTSNDYAADPDLKFVHYDELRRRWIADMLGEDAIRSKFALFWHNHFVTTLNVVDCTSYLWDYYSLLNASALGNFRTFVRSMGESAAMLVYLNGNQNVAAEPNENYARELLELFTLGENNGYTQVDIIEMSRALTGWQVQMYQCTPPYFDPTQHDNTPKTIFGQTQNFGFTSAHNLIFAQRAQQVSEYICTKLYKNYVYQKVDPAIIQGLATTFRNSNWEILPVLKQLFKSEHFFETEYINARIKNPLESMLPLLKMNGAQYPANLSDNQLGDLFYWSLQIGQELLSPPNVAGWPGYHAWINESTLTGRWTYSEYTVYQLTLNESVRNNLRTLALTLTNESNNPVIIVEALTDFYMSQTLDAVHLQAAVAYFKSGIPENYFEDGSWNLYWDEAPGQIVNLLYYLVRLPEYQLT